MLINKKTTATFMVTELSMTPKWFVTRVSMVVLVMTRANYFQVKSIMS